MVESSKNRWLDRHSRKSLGSRHYESNKSNDESGLTNPLPVPRLSEKTVDPVQEVQRSISPAQQISIRDHFSNAFAHASSDHKLSPIRLCMTQKDIY